MSLYGFRDANLDTFTKQDFPTALALFHFINATYSLTCESSYGYYNNKTGKHNGIFGKLSSNDIDIAGLIFSTV